jgi:drug/metabolite transporter superfamily protein YnfA
MSYIMMFTVPLLFEIQACYRLIQKFGYHNALLWISVVIAVMLDLCVLLYVWFGKLLESIA